MTTATQPIQTQITQETLIEDGFTHEEIRKLKALRSVYPHAEFVESQQQWEQLVFLKWLIAQGKVEG